MSEKINFLKKDIVDLIKEFSFKARPTEKKTYMSPT